MSAVNVSFVRACVCCQGVVFGQTFEARISPVLSERRAVALVVG